MIVKGPQQSRTVATPGKGIENSMAGPDQEEEDKVEKPPFGKSPCIPGKKSGKKKADEEPQEKGMGEPPVPPEYDHRGDENKIRSRPDPERLRRERRLAGNNLKRSGGRKPSQRRPPLRHG